jgi:hypothetical protein
MLLVLVPKGMAQAPALGTASGFALFSSNGAVSNTGLSQLTGNVGTNNGLSTAFGNVNGVMHDNDGASLIAAADLLLAYNQLDAAIPTNFPSSLLGNGQTLNAGIYSIGASATLDGVLTLDGQNNANAVFIIQIEGAFSSSAASQVILANNAQACNVFWKVEGLVSLASQTQLKGTIVANNAAIVLNSGVIIEGRALSTTGAVTINGSTVATPIGCGSPVLTGPAAPLLASVECYTIFSGNGEVTNSGVSHVTGDVGTNVGLTTGFDNLNVTGTVHENPDTSTAQCAADLNVVYSYLNLLPVDIELLYPAAFGNNLVLTPHTYLLNAATVLNGTVTLDAQNNANAVFVIKINGAFSSSTYAEVVLINGAQIKNVFWKIDGAVQINDYSEIKGTLVGNNGAINLTTGTQIDGRALTTNGSISTNAVTAVMPIGCTTAGLETVAKNNATFYPNPFTNVVQLANAPGSSSELKIYNMLGKLVMTRTVTGSTATIETDFAPGMYFFRLIDENGKVQTGKLMAK